MRLTQIRVENYSRLANTAIAVRKHLILVGPNDVGKSSLLRCLDLLLGASTAQLYNRVSIDDFADSSLPFIVEVELENLDPIDEGWFPDESKVDPLTSRVTLAIRLTCNVDPNGTVSIDRSSPHSGTNRQLSRDQIAALGWTLLGATALARDLRDDRRTALTDILQRVDLTPEKAGFDTLIAQIQKGLQASTILDQLRDDLAAQLTKALPVAIDKDHLEIVSAMADGDVLGDARLRVTRDGTAKDITEQSDGLRALYALALHDLVSAGANMVAVDEPEIHLHPTSQRSLARLLRDGPNQKILATHSADVVSAFPPDCIVSVRPGGKVIQPQADFLSDDEKMVVHWWVRDKLEPLTAARVLAVEGVSDRILVEQVAELTDRTLDRVAVSIVETDGAGDMGAILKLFGAKGFDIPLTLLIDEDARLKTAEFLGVLPGELEMNGVVVSSPDLEAEYIAALGAAGTWKAFTDSGLYSHNELSTCARNGSRGVPNEEDLRAFVTKKRKVRAAMAVARALDAATARKIVSIDVLLASIARP